MSLRDPDTRKALRAIVGAVIAISLTAMVWFYAPDVTPRALATLLNIALLIIGLRVFFDGAENSINAISFKVSQKGAEGTVTPPDASAAADAVASAAMHKADEIKATDPAHTQGA